MKKYDLDLLKNALAENFDVDPQGWDKEEIKALLCDSLDAEELESRDYRFGTPDECWAALMSMAEAIEAGEAVPPAVGLWFLAGINRTKNQDINELVRALGFIEHGRARLHNKFDLVKRMIELIDEQGMKKSEASRTCAAEFKVHPETCMHWYRKRDQVFSHKAS